MQDTISLMVYPSEESFINQFVAPKMVVIPLYLASTMWLTHSQCGGDPFTQICQHVVFDSSISQADNLLANVITSNSILRQKEDFCTPSKIKLFPNSVKSVVKCQQQNSLTNPKNESWRFQFDLKPYSWISSEIDYEPYTCTQFFIHGS